jgi:hypothetical protein
MHQETTFSTSLRVVEHIVENQILVFFFNNEKLQFATQKNKPGVDEYHALVFQMFLLFIFVMLLQIQVNC